MLKKTRRIKFREWWITCYNKNVLKTDWRETFGNKGTNYQQQEDKQASLQSQQDYQWKQRQLTRSTSVYDCIRAVLEI